MREGGVGYPQAVHERVDRHVRSSGRCLRRRRRNAGMMRPPPVTFGELGGTRSKAYIKEGAILSLTLCPSVNRKGSAVLFLAQSWVRVPGGSRARGVPFSHPDYLQVAFGVLGSRDGLP